MLHLKSLKIPAVKAFGGFISLCFPGAEGAAAGRQAFRRQKPPAEGAAFTVHRFLRLAEADGMHQLDFFFLHFVHLSECFEECFTSRFLFLGFKLISVVVYQDWERLGAALGDIQTYWDMLERKRKQLEEEEEEEEEQMAGSVLRHTLPQGIKHIQLDLEDLMGQVSSQVSLIFSQLLPESASTMQQPQFSPSSVDEEHSELQDEADSTSRKRKPEQRKPLQNSVGQPSGGLHHSEGPGPLPHQAGERLPPVGFQNPHDEAVRKQKKTRSAQNQNIPTGRNTEQCPEGKAPLS